MAKAKHDGETDDVFRCNTLLAGMCKLAVGRRQEEELSVGRFKMMMSAIDERSGGEQNPQSL